MTDLRSPRNNLSFELNLARDKRSPAAAYAHAERQTRSEALIKERGKKAKREGRKHRPMCEDLTFPTLCFFSFFQRPHLEPFQIGVDFCNRSTVDFPVQIPLQYVCSLLCLWGCGGGGAVGKRGAEEAKRNTQWAGTGFTI